MSEKSGTGGVQPHNAILKGEIIERIKIKYYIKSKNFAYSSYKLQRTLEIKMYSSATVWQFLKVVTKALEFSPRYALVTLPNEEQIVDTMHGMVMSQLGIKNGDTITVKKKDIEEVIEKAPLILEDKSALVPKAAEIFSEWFDMYKNPESGTMNDECVARFVTNATRQDVNKFDDRVAK